MRSEKRSEMNWAMRASDGVLLDDLLWLRASP
jgi:hypothetical protein